MCLGHGMQHWECGLYQALTNDDSGLTYTYYTMATMPICGKTLKIFMEPKGQ